MSDQIPLSDAMKDPESRERIEHFIMLMRIALAPVFNEDEDAIPMNQSYAMTAAALFAGMTASHMIALGTMVDGDKRRAGQMILANSATASSSASARPARLSFSRRRSGARHDPQSGDGGAQERPERHRSRRERPLRWELYR